MKKFQITLVVFVLILNISMYAQAPETFSTRPSFSHSRTKSVQLVSPEKVPFTGTFHLLSGQFEVSGELSKSSLPPYPFDPYKGALPVFTFDPFSAEFLIGDTPEDYQALRQSGMMMNDGLPSPGEGGGSTNYENDPFPPAYDYSTSDLWLEIIQMTNTTAHLAIHPSTGATNMTYDLYFVTNLEASPVWNRVRRCAPGQINFFVTNLPSAQGFFKLGPTNNAIRPGFTNVVLARNDDNHTGGGPFGPFIANLLATIGFPINFYGNYYTNLHVNNNGNVTFNVELDEYVADPLIDLQMNIIAPFWADADTRNTNTTPVSYGTNTVNGRGAFGVNWINVGYYQEQADRLLSCQLVIIDRSDIASGDFDMEFNYDKVEWEWGSAAVGNSPRAGFSDGNISYELTGSGVLGSFLNSNLATGLIYHSLNSFVSGRYIFFFRSGQPLP